MTSFQLENSSTTQIRISKAWFFLGIFTLLASGVFSLLLVLLRTPVLSELIPWVDFFRTALVAHVDLSVLIWFLSFTAIFWSLNNRKSAVIIDQLTLWITLAGTLLIIITPFSGQTHPIINNYIPVLNDRLFLTGLIIIALSFALFSIRSVLSFSLPDLNQLQSVPQIAVFLSIVTLIFTLAAQLYSYLSLQPGGNIHTYFEFLFWGSGHTLQFSHVLLLYVAWMWMSSATGVTYSLRPAVYAALFVLCFLPVLIVPVIYFLFPVLSPEHRIYFTELMRLGGLTALPLGTLIALNIFNRSAINDIQKPVRIAFVCSVVLFTSGGVLGFMIEGVNVVIPAHYHGSIVGVTLAFMGISYLLLPVFGYKAPAGKLVKYQPVVYATGQMMHIIGLAWSGGYGVQRKTAGADQALKSLEQIAGMGLMGLGGLIAIIGGILFLVVILASIYRK